MLACMLCSKQMPIICIPLSFSILSYAKATKKEIIFAKLENNCSVVMGVTYEQILDPGVSL